MKLRALCGEFDPKPLPKEVSFMRNTNLTGKNAEDALRYMRENEIKMWPKLERELERETQKRKPRHEKTSNRR